ncbi:metallophosphoesterase family protein [Tuwongella immobilis]|uniref:Calcineurin-like phosphoesterase domain-containing protein n=1 Tax=Tuwongella immobilis TaxID=692036 RepID=A0A6C2YUG5_9BACT|nr:metallophosphoesterase [Tuwongella immobilis]VIP05260.1 metallophosphoesterase : Metallophosphoesterase OS=Plesiocystis pacifica SIR-1 GN=PPSIR1_13003 PE=4 SV=1: Metallophos_2 [Tuwongella immobilis]VTS07876.1 metallophosphoesterase : Metallophosphoesterase OS=Plesiocystis pacifica SIR-1 GN=PPSIR1_13003 PE=4 SV=1: Metallophos_2 [Tuwongella immobilis]
MTTPVVDSQPSPSLADALPGEIRLAHFSDIHLTVRRLGWTWRDLFSKRATGWLNLKLFGRGARFREAPQVTEALMAELRSRPLDRLVFSGDASMMAFETELAYAAEQLGVGRPDQAPGLAVPGNHDAYTRRAVRQGNFESYFAPWQVGEREGDETYPFAQKVGEYWLIGVNSARPRIASWDASGRVGKPQRQRLERLLSRLGPGRRILVTHYPLFTETGRLEPLVRRLRDWKEVLRIAREYDVALWLNGHRHRGYYLPANEDLPFPLICVGSATQRNRWSYNEYRIQERNLRAIRRVFDPLARQYTDGGSFSLQLASAAD